MAIVTVRQDFGDDKFPVKADKINVNHYAITSSQLLLVTQEHHRNRIQWDDVNGECCGIFHKANLNFQ